MKYNKDGAGLWDRHIKSPDTQNLVHYANQAHNHFIDFNKLFPWQVFWLLVQDKIMVKASRE